MTADEGLQTHSFRVYGDPAPQSGMRAVGPPGAMRLITTGGKDLEQWRRAIATEAEVAKVNGSTHRGPVAVYVDFRYQMPSNRKAAQRRAESIPRMVQPDLDKLVRAVFDSLKVGGLILDDGQIAEIHASKSEYSDSWTGAEVSVRDLWTP